MGTGRVKFCGQHKQMTYTYATEYVTLMLKARHQLKETLATNLRCFNYGHCVSTKHEQNKLAIAINAEKSKKP